MRDRRGRGWKRENQSTPPQNQAYDARHLSAQIVANTAKTSRTRLRKIAPASSTLGLPLCTYEQNCKSLANRLRHRDWGQCFTRLLHLSQFALALVSFGEAELPLHCEYRRRYRRALPGAPHTRPDFAWCATPSDKQTSTERRDVRCSPTCRSANLPSHPADSSAICLAGVIANDFCCKRSRTGRGTLFSYATRNLVSTGASGRRRSIDIVSSEYANLDPQSKHTL